MQYTYTRTRSEAELLEQRLQSQDQIVFRVPGIRWQEVERQVEKLGFGDRFVVAAAAAACSQKIEFVTAGARKRPKFGCSGGKREK